MLLKWRLNVVFLIKKPTPTLNWLLLTTFPPESYILRRVDPFFKHLICHLRSYRNMSAQRAAEKIICCSEQFNSFFSAALYSGASIAHRQSGLVKHHFKAHRRTHMYYCDIFARPSCCSMSSTTSKWPQCVPLNTGISEKQEEKKKKSPSVSE